MSTRPARGISDSENRLARRSRLHVPGRSRRARRGDRQRDVRAALLARSGRRWPDACGRRERRPHDHRGRRRRARQQICDGGRGGGCSCTVRSRRPTCHASSRCWCGPPRSTQSTLKEAVRGLDPGLAVFNVTPLSEAISLSLLPARIAGSLLGALGTLALVLAALGIYGVLSYLVRARTREIGVRVAVGATPRAVVGLIVGQACRWTLIGGAARHPAVARGHEAAGRRPLRREPDGSGDLRRGRSSPLDGRRARRVGACPPSDPGGPAGGAQGELSRDSGLGARGSGIRGEPSIDHPG